MRIQHDQGKRSSVYCFQGQHVTVTDPIYPYSGEPHQIELAACDCPKAPEAEPTEGG